jgi:hypothetical protein
MKKNDELKEILGYEPGRGQRLEFLKQVRETGKSIQEIASDYQMPEIFIDKNNTGIIETKEGKMSIKDYQAKHPFKKIVIIY